tara:strand:- start:6167 stop:7225 length:1059 start_codon:yes stop_codon:yes gene_type:complete
MKWFLPISAVVLLAVMVAWMAGSFDEKVAPEFLGKTQTKPATDSFFEVKVKAYELLEPVPATIAAKQTAVISSRILARIEEVKVRAGDYVKKGQELVLLERSDLKSRVSQANSQIKSIDARLNEAKQSLDRSVELNKRGLLALAPLETSQANYKSLLAQKTSAQQALVEAKTALNYASVVAPFDGLIVDRFTEPGSMAQPGMSLLSLYNPSSVRVEASVREERAVQLEIGQTLKMDIPSKGLALSAEIEELVPAGDSSSRTFLVKSQINDISGLLPGMYARLLIPAGISKRILIPENYVAEVGQLNIVWVMQGTAEDQLVEKRFIKVGLVKEGGMIEVISGLKEGEFLFQKP